MSNVRLLMRSLRFRIIALVLVATLPALGLAVYNGFVQRSLAAKGAQEDALRIAHLAANRQQALVEGTRQLLIAISQMPQIQDADPKACIDLITRLQAQYSSYANLGVAQLDGRVTCSSVNTPSLVNIMDRPYFQAALSTKQFVIGEFTIDRFTGLPVLPFAFPVKDSAGAVQRVAIAIVRLDWIDNVVAQTSLPPGASVLVVDRRGTVLSRYPDPADWSGKNLPDSPLIKTILKQHGEGTIEVAGVDGIERLNAFTSLDTTDADSPFINVGIPLTVAYADANRALRLNLIILGLVSALALLAAWYFSDVFILRQVRSLVRAIGKLTAGDLNARTGVDYEQGEVGFLAQSFDRMAVTLQQRDKQLSEAEARYRTLVEQIPAVTYTSSMTANGKMVYISPQIEAISGYTVEEWLENSDFWASRVSQDDLPRVTAEIEETLMKGVPFRSEYRMVNKNGGTVWVRDEATIVRDDQGEPLLRQGIIVDITELRLVEDALKDYALQLERSNQELQDFAYIASHDLQEPLRKIQAFGERLELKYDHNLDEVGLDYVHRMRNSAERMQNLINDLLSYSRVSTRGRPFVRTNLSSVVEEALSNLETRIEETGGSVSVEELPVIDADPIQMAQLFQNLIGNALKFHRPDVKPEVKITCEMLPRQDYSQGKIVNIRVQDNGIGFDEKYLDRIFLPFQRLHGRQEYEGSGIGLAICRKIAERHGGTLNATSAPGKGSSFIITLPTYHSPEQRGSMGIPGE